MSDDVKAAAERSRKIAKAAMDCTFRDLPNYDRVVRETYGDNLEADIQKAISTDMITTADELLRRLEADEAERAERAKPIDEAWLRSIDFDGPYKDRPKDEVSLEAIYGGGYLSWSPMGGARLCDLHLGFTTRGQLLDLLRALGVEPKGGQS